MTETVVETVAEAEDVVEPTTSQAGVPYPMTRAILATKDSAVGVVPEWNSVNDEQRAFLDNHYKPTREEAGGIEEIEPLSLALFEQLYGKGILLSEDSWHPDTGSTAVPRRGGHPLHRHRPSQAWNLSMTAQVIEWDRLERDDANFCQRLREGRESFNDYFSVYRCKVSIWAELILTRGPRSPFIPQDHFRIKWSFSVPHFRRRNSRNAVEITVRPHPYSTLDDVFTDLLVALYGTDFIPQRGREIRTTIQPYKYRNKKSINKCIKFEQKRGKYRSTEPHY